MSTVFPAGVPALSPEAAPSAAKEIRRPLLWLLGIVALALVLRAARSWDAGLQVDEFAALAAVAERQDADTGRPLAPGITPTAADPLVPVASLAEVSSRSVIPYGIQDPVPLYHDVLWAFVKVLPVSAWSVRLPSLLAGLGCVVAVFFLCRRLFGTEVALVAALFVALDPMQIATSWLAQPFALANLATVLSFAALWGLLHAGKPAAGALLALGYAVCVAAVGYLNAALLFVVVAHVGMVVYALRGGAAGAAWKAACWGLGLAVAAGLLAPEFSYQSRVYEFGRAHRDYLAELNKLWVLRVLWHNLALIGGLLLVPVVGYIIRWQLEGGGPEEKPEGEAAPAPEGALGGTDGGAATAITAAPAAAPAVAPTAAPAAAEAEPEPEGEPLPENDEALWMSRLWVFLPQAAAMVVAALLLQTIFATRFLTFTTLGGAILIAYYATRDRRRDVRLGVAGAVAVALFAFGFADKWSLGDGRLFSNAKARDIVARQDVSGGLAGTGMVSAWKEGDVVLMRSGLLEADFLRTDIPPQARPQVERAILAPLTTLYPDRNHKPVIALTFSQYRTEKIKTPGAEKAPLQDYYDAEFVAKLKGYQRYWMTGVGPDADPNSWYYLTCFVPWLASELDRGPLVLARNREGLTERYVTIEPNLGPDQPIEGLTKDRKAEDFNNLLHIVRPKTKEDKAREDKAREDKAREETR